MTQNATPTPNIDLHGLWAIEPSRGQAIFQALASKDAGLQAAAKLSAQNGRHRDAESVAVVSISGVMTKYGSDYYPGGSMAVASEKLLRAAADPTVSSIILVVDSPGGTVAGTADLAADVRTAAAAKPVYAFVEDLCASAAYWVASQATEIHANQPTAFIGSIGTYTVIYDVSRMFENAGIETLVIATGPHKGAGVFGAKISDDQKAHWQTLVDKAQKSFASGVQSGRKFTDAQLAAVADGRVWLADDALQSKLIDAVTPFGALVSRAAAAASSRKKGRTMSAEKDDAPRGASLSELKQAVPGASSDFIVRQLERNATVAQARESWLDERTVALDKRDEAIKAKETDLDKREKDVKAAEEKAKAKPGLKVLKDPDPNAEEQGAGGTAEAEFDSLVAAKMKAGMSKPKAVQAVVRENKELHQRMLDEAPRADIERKRA